MKVFISFSAKNVASAQLADRLRRLLEALGLEPLDGYSFAGGKLNEKIRRLIRQCNLLIRVVITNTRYGTDESAYARSLSIPVITLVDEANAVTDTLYSDEHFISFEGLDDFSFAIEIIKAVESERASGGYLFTSEHNDVHIARDRRDMLNALISSEFFKISQRKKNFHYDITLERHDDPELSKNYFRAFFAIRFEATLKSDKVVLEMARTVDNFQQIYSHLIQDQRSVYRYILKTDDPIPFDKSHFKIRCATLNNMPLRCSNISPAVKVDHLQLHYECDTDIKSLMGTRVEIAIDIETIVDNRRGEFTIIFGYPVKNVHLSLNYRDTDIEHVEIVDVVTAQNKVHKSRMPGTVGTGVKANLNGWTFPDSAIVYVWRRAHAG